MPQSLAKKRKKEKKKPKKKNIGVFYHDAKGFLWRVVENPIRTVTESFSETLNLQSRRRPDEFWEKPDD